ncbi:hypothetical protein GN244_ATG01899 [Phytophthora infestans]|uniref:Uncharacterized protein n=1 Tax=Phytophthora infestans TaxID=4787 RepID=A0A833WMJ9_PHYIN|nr:hypothetical protein GN244_ATG01899 [Phytophthora infestans]
MAHDVDCSCRDSTAIRRAGPQDVPDMVGKFWSGLTSTRSRRRFFALKTNLLKTIARFFDR